MRNRDQIDGKLVSLDAGDIGEDDMGVRIQFQDVWFKYPTRDTPILNGLSFTVSGPDVLILHTEVDVLTPHALSNLD